MSFRKVDVIVEPGQSPNNAGTGSETPAWFQWDVAFLVVCVIAVAADPLFLYIPVINHASKCIMIDNTLKIIAICVRSFLDLVALGDLVARKIYKCPKMKCSDYVINILSILPVNQILLTPNTFSEIVSDSKIQIWKFLNAVVLLQYLPRIFRIYRLGKIVNDGIILPRSLPNASTGTVNENNRESCNKNIRMRIVLKAGFNLFLYLLASHALGAFWYFFSIQRETKCWQSACEHDIGCIKSISKFCGTIGFRNYTIDFCPIEKPNIALFDFGIFKEARQSGILASMDFPRKTMFCFWWGLRNLSSLGSNLQTSPYYWQNCFTILISIIGMILFLYFIRNLQVYMQQETENELEKMKGSDVKLEKMKRLDVELEKIECLNVELEKLLKRLNVELSETKLS